MKVVIGADHGGFELKNKISEWLQEANVEVMDAGNHILDPKDDYPDYAMKVAEVISQNQADKGIVLCGSGIGACITANKFKGVRASICHDTYSAHQGVEHDDMNVLCIGARIIGEQLAKEVVFSFINASFINEDRFLRRLNKLKSLDK